MKSISDQDCRLSHSKELINILVYLSISFDRFVPEKCKAIIEGINSVENMTQKSAEDISKEVIIEIYKRMFPSSANENQDLNAEFDKYLSKDKTGVLRLLVNFIHPMIILNPELMNEIGYLSEEKRKYLASLFQNPTPDIDIIANKKAKKSMTKREKTLAILYPIFVVLL